MRESFNRQTVVKFRARDFERVRKVAESLGLSTSEIISRATAEGLKSFCAVRLPDSSESQTVRHWSKCFRYEREFDNKLSFMRYCEPDSNLEWAQTMDFWKKIPTKILITLTLAVFLFLSALVWYAVIYKNTPVEIFGIVRFGERDDALRVRLLKAQADSESRIAPEVHNTVLLKLKEAESKHSDQNIESGKLKVQLKERNDRITELTKEMTQTKAGLETVKNDLQLARKESQEITRQSNELKKKMEEISALGKKRAIEASVRQLSDLEKLATEVTENNKRGFTYSYNEILTSLKKEIPGDFYIQTTAIINSDSHYSTLAPTLRTSISQLRTYLEQRYLQ